MYFNTWICRTAVLSVGTLGSAKTCMKSRYVFGLEWSRERANALSHVVHCRPVLPGNGATQLRHEKLHLLFGQKTSQGCPQLQAFPFFVLLQQKVDVLVPGSLEQFSFSVYTPAEYV